MVGREPTKSGQEYKKLVAGYWLFALRKTGDILKPLYFPIKEDYLKPGKSQTVVFIALEDLGPQNGFPLDLKKGLDVCFDGDTTFWVPPAGGGRGIYICLDL